MEENTLPLYSTAQVRELDRVAIEEFGIPGYTLMTRAGAGVLRVLRERWPKARRIVVVCGVGNNGGDGLVMARLAKQAGLVPLVMQLGDPRRLRGDAATAAKDLTAAGIAMEKFDVRRLQGADVVVDAVLGTGVKRPLEGQWLEAIQAINQYPAPVLAIDIPSGLNGNTGMPMGVSVHAACTVSFIGRKQGLTTGQGPEFCGTQEFDDLGVPAEVVGKIQATAVLITPAILNSLQIPRPRHTHKGMCGHVLVVGGDHGTGGAVRLAAEAAARVGAGLVSIATRAAHAAVITATCPELMCHGVESGRDLQPLLNRATVVAVGPGLGQSTWATQLLCQVLDHRKPLVVDADALNLLAQDLSVREEWVLTPHPGEAGRLLGSDAESIQQDRFAAVSQLAQRYGGVCVLKGAGTLIAAPGDPVAVSPTGNPGMASGGMGDVLTGVIAGFMAQGLSICDAAKAGAYVHGAAADLAATKGERGLLAGDVLACLRTVINP
ncbi:MAG: NAD(P)H-hydrate dehydratase [Gammaproteobacteria bacterium]